MLARYAVLPSPSLASGPQVLLLSKLKAPINHAESTLLQVFFLKNLKSFGISTYEKQGEGSPLSLTGYYKRVAARNVRWNPSLPSSVHSSKPCRLQLLCLPLACPERSRRTRKHPGCVPTIPILELHSTNAVHCSLSLNPHPLFLYAVFQQIFQLAHEFLHVLEVHIHRCESHVGDFIQFLQPVHDHFTDFRGSQLAFRGLLHHTLDFVHNRFQLGRGHRTFFASLQESLQNLLPLEALAPPVFLDDHVRNFVDAFVGGEPPAAFQALAPAANGVANAALPRADHLIVNVRAKRTLHWAESPCCAALSMAASFSCSAISFNFPSESPSWISSGTPARLHAAKVINHSTMDAAKAASVLTRKIFVYAMVETACDPPPTPGSCNIEPTSETARTSIASERVRVPRVPPKLFATQKYISSTRNQWAAE